MNRFFMFMILFPGFYFQVHAQDAVSITRQMFVKVKSIQTLQYTFDSKERINGRMYHEKSDFKISVSPFRVYLHQYVPKNGMECLYVSGENSGKAWVNPNSFPWVTLSLDPKGDLMLNNHHHSVFEAGYGYTAGLIEYLMDKYQGQSSQLITDNGLFKINGVLCYSFTFNNPGYKMVSYTVGENETPFSIASKFHINYYAVLDNNPSVKGVGVIKPGTKLTLPNDYASKMELFIQKGGLYPVYLKIYDQKGLYEEYTFSDIVVNPSLTDIDFSEENPKYHF